MATVIPEVTAQSFVDGLGVVQYLLKAGLPSTVHVFTAIPDHLAELLPDGVVVIRRASGSSTQPQFHSAFTLSVQVWAGTDQAAFTLSRSVGTVLFNAWLRQTISPLGHIARWRESSGFQEFPDDSLEGAGRYIAVLDLLIRNPRST